MRRIQDRQAPRGSSATIARRGRRYSHSERPPNERRLRYADHGPYPSDRAEHMPTSAGRVEASSVASSPHAPPVATMVLRTGPGDDLGRFAVDSAVGVAARPRPRTPRGGPSVHDTRSPRPHGCTQATRLACSPRRATLAPRDRRADPRGVFALPRDEAAPSRLPQLRLLPGPPGDRAQAGRR